MFWLWFGDLYRPKPDKFDIIIWQAVIITGGLVKPSIVSRWYQEED